MRQFDVLENPNEASRRYAPYVVVLQSHHLAPLDTVFVAPVVRDAQRILSLLDVAVVFRDEKLAVAIAEAAGVRRSQFGLSVGSLQSHEDDFRRAFERLLSGF